MKTGVFVLFPALSQSPGFYLMKEVANFNSMSTENAKSIFMWQFLHMILNMSGEDGIKKWCLGKELE